MQAVVVTLAQNLELENQALLRRDPAILRAVDHGDRLVEMQARLDAATAAGSTVVVHYDFDSIAVGLIVPFGVQDGTSLGLQLEGHRGPRDLRRRGQPPVQRVRALRRGVHRPARDRRSLAERGGPAGLTLAPAAAWPRRAYPRPMTLVDAELIPEHIEHRVTLPDGRILAAAEWGDPNGTPFITIHGTPGGRISWWQDPDIYRRFGLRRITYDRPGYGDSTRHPGRSVVDAVADVEHLTAALGIDRFLVSGGSGGGPHALALAALLPDRVMRCIANVSVAPFDAEGLDWMAGMTEGNVIEFGAAVEGEEAARAVVEPLRERELQHLADGNVNWMGDDYALSEADQAQMRKHFARVRAHIANGLAPGADGWIDDLLVFVKPWGFDVASIRVPVLVTYGRSDVLVPAAHGDWLAKHVPGAEVAVDDVAGHMGDDDAIEREYTWLTGRAAAPAG